jgi:hypothetical protein
MVNNQSTLTRWILVAVGVALTSLFITMRPGSAARQISDTGNRARPATVIVHCVYYASDSASPFRTELRGVEASEGVDVRLETGGRCSDAVSHLSALGFAIVSSTSTAGDFDNNGTVDAADYVLWRRGGPLNN